MCIELELQHIIPAVIMGSETSTLLRSLPIFKSALAFLATPLIAWTLYRLLQAIKAVAMVNLLRLLTLIKINSLYNVIAAAVARGIPHLEHCFVSF